MAVQLEGLEFQIESNVEGATKGIDLLAASMTKLKTIGKGGFGLTAGANQLKKLSEAVNSFEAAKAEAMGNALTSLSNMKIPTTLSKRLSELVNVTKQITPDTVTNLQNYGQALQTIANTGRINLPRIPQNNTPTAPANPATPAPASPAQPVNSGVEHVNEQLQETHERTNRLRSLLGGMGSAFHGAFAPMIGLLRNVKNSLSGVNQEGTKTRSILSSIGDRINPSLFADQVKKSFGGLKSQLSSVGRVLKYRVIRFILSTITKAFTTGIKNLYEYSKIVGDGFAGTMDSLATNAQYLSNSLGAMAAPLISAVAPAIDYVVGKIVELLNWVNMLFARLSGASVATVAKKASKSFGDAAKSASGSAGKAAKELKKTILGFDEINKLVDQNDGGSGGGGGSHKTTPDYGSMFQQVAIDNGIKAFADQIKAAFKAGDWMELGKIIGDKVNEVVDMIDYAKVGQKIGYGINGAIQTAYSFLSTVNFHTIGVRISQLLNNMLDGVDVYYLGALVVRKTTLVWDMFIGAIEELDFKQVTKKISDYFMGWMDEWTKWLDSYDWTKLGSELWQKLKDLIEGIDFAGLSESFFKLLGTAWRAQIQFLGGFFGSIGSDLKTWWDEDIKGQNWVETADNLLNAIDQGFKDLAGWCMEHIVDPFCNALLGEDTWGDIKQGASDMWNAFTSGVREFFDDPTDFIWNHIIDPFCNSTLGVRKWEGMKSGANDMWKSFTEGVNSFLHDPLGFVLDNMIQPIIDGLISLFNTPAHTEAIRETGGTAGTLILDGIKEKFADMTQWAMDNIIDPVGTALFGEEKWTDIKGVASDIWKNFTKGIDEFFKNPIDFITNNIVNPFCNTFFGENTWDALLNVGVRIWNSFVTGVTNAFKDVGDWIQRNIIDPIMAPFNALGDFLSNPFGINGGSGSGVDSNGKGGGGRGFASGGVIQAYAGGTNRVKRGSMFLAGESGAEILGHINGRTEVMNRFQLASVMRTAVLQGMAPYAQYVDAVNGQQTGLFGDNVGSGNQEELADAIRMGVSDNTSRQNDLLREQNDILRRLLDKDTTVEVTASSMTKALNRKNQRDGKVIVPIGT